MKKIITSFMLCASIVAIQLPVSFEAQAFAEEKQKRKVYLPGPTVGKKVGKAFEAYSADDIDGALAILTDITAKKDYDKAFVNYFTGQMYAMKGDAKKAISFLEKAVAPDILNESDHGNTLKLLADLQMQEKQYKLAIKNYHAWMDFTGKEDGGVWTRIANAYYETKQLAKVIAPADKAIAAYGDKQNQNPYVLKVTSFYERKMYKEAVKVLEIVVQLFPEKKQWWTQLGQFYALIENYPKALATLDLAYKQGYLEKESEFRLLANLFQQSDVPYIAASIYEKHIDSGEMKRDDKNIASLANAWHAAQHIDKAAKYYGELAKITGDAKHYNKQGSLLKQDEQYKKAVKALNKAIELGIKDKGRTYMSIAEAHFYLGEYKQAYKAFKNAEKDPKTRKYAKSWLSHTRDTAKRKGKSI
jgi:tetratricopeptide (TPR) repeat protein